MAGMMSAQSVAIRPLDKGMILDKPSQTAPDGAFLQLQNYVATLQGPKRIPGFAEFAARATAPDPFVDYLTIWRLDGSQISLLMTKRFLYVVNPLSGFAKVDWGFSPVGTADVVSNTITAASDDFITAGVMVGDIVNVGATSGTVSKIVDLHNIEVENSTILPAVGVTFTVDFTFTPGNNALPDWTIFQGNLAIADGKHPLLRYDATLNTMGFWTTDPAKKLPGGVDFIPACVSSFANRIFCGYTLDTIDGVQRQRLRWSSLADETDFSILTAYLDLPYVNGAMRRIVPLGAMLVAYFDDAVFVGMQTNNAVYPIRFDLVDTGGIGIVGPKAITSYLGGHFFVGQDDIYLLTSEGAQRIGSPILGPSLKTCQFPQRCYVAMDTWNDSVVFGFPTNTEVMTRLWYFNYKAKAWSFVDIETYMIANPIVNTSVTWDEVTSTWDSAGSLFSSWDAAKIDDPRKFLMLESQSSLWKGTEAASGNWPVVDGFGVTTMTPINTGFITKDHDFDSPDELKTFVRFGVKIDVITGITANVLFAAFVSINRGRTWKPVGPLEVTVDKDEGYVNFRVTGSTLQVKLMSTSQVESYVITEYTIKARQHGSERDTSTQV